jgi:hypothetical protein
MPALALTIVFPSDLLNRHRNIHEDSREKSKRSTETPSRAAKACAFCAAKKIRCEGGPPCVSCQKKGLVCEYSLPPRKRRAIEPAASIDRPSRPEHLEKLDNFLGATGIVEVDVESVQPQSPSERRANAQPTDLDIIDVLVGPVQPQSSPGELDDSRLGDMNIGGVDAGPVQPHSSSEQLVDNFDSLGDFFESILLPEGGNHRPSANHVGTFTPRDFLYFGHDQDSDPLNLDCLFLQPHHYEPEAFAASDLDNSDAVGSTSAHARSDAFKNSLWCWAPRRQEQPFSGLDSLQTPESVACHEEDLLIQPLASSVEVDQKTRDMLLIMLSDAFQRSDIQTPSLSAFPSAKILTDLLRLSFVQDTLGPESWVRLDIGGAERPRTVLIAALVANGASRSHLPTIHRFGFALQEAMRIKMYSLYDSDNSLGRDLCMLQSQILNLHTGLWSGQSRLIEIAESFLQVPVTMLRRAGKFRFAQYSSAVVDSTDTADQVSDKWIRWKSDEAYKRLVYQLFAQDCHTSIALLVNPSISAAELHLPLPLSGKLWAATTAQEWQSILQMYTTQIPSLADCINDITNFTHARDRVDFIPSALSILHGYWGLIWSFRQLVSINNSSTVDGAAISPLMIVARKHELLEVLNRFRAHVISYAERSVQHTLDLIVDLLTMYLHVSMEELQVFAGKEGIEDSRRVFPRLRRWVLEQDSKQSVWSAGQVLRHAKRYAPGTLRNFAAIAVYHASLTLWSYGVIYRTSLSSDNFDRSSIEATTCFPVDGPASEHSQRFLMFGQGSPSISVNPRLSVEETIDTSSAGVALLTDPQATMRICLRILEHNFEVQDEQGVVKEPPLVFNLCQLMRDLNKAADFVFR